MSKFTNALAKFFGRLFPMSCNRTLALNEELKQDGNEHFAKLCEMLSCVESRINDCIKVCNNNTELIKICQNEIQALADEQILFKEDMTEKLSDLRADVEDLAKQNERINEELRNEISAEFADTIENLTENLTGCISEKSELLISNITDSDKRSSKDSKHIADLIENGIADGNKQLAELRSADNSLAYDIRNLADSVTAGFDNTSKTGEYTVRLDKIDTANAGLSSDIKTLADSVTAGFDNTAKTGEYTVRLDKIDTANAGLSSDIKTLAESVTAGFDNTAKTGEYTVRLDKIDTANAGLSSDIKTLAESVTAGFDNTAKTGEYTVRLDKIDTANAGLSSDIKTLAESVTAGFDNTAKTGEYTVRLDKIDNANAGLTEDVKTLAESITTGFETTSKSGEYSDSVTAFENTVTTIENTVNTVENTVNTVRREMNLFKRQSYLRRLYFHPSEREALANLFKDAMSREDSAQRFDALVSGLDTESRNTVSDILHRMSMVADGNKSLQDVYTQREQDEFVRMNDEFSSKIVKLNDDLYYYNGYYLPVNQFDSSVFFTKYGIDRLTTLDGVRNKDIIDAGGYVGDTALLFSPYTDKKIHVFEASPSNMDIINKTIKLNHLDNIVTVSKALGDKNGTATFSLGERNSCNSLVERPGYNYPDHIEVPVVTLDDYVRENNLNVGLIKVDIEGGEQLLLKGAVETIRTQHPILLISIYHSANDFFEIKPMIEKICDKYTFKVVKPINSAIALETILLAEIK